MASELIESARGKTGYEEPLRIFGLEISLKVTGDQTGGAWSMIEQLTPPGGGPPLHRHSREDEGIYIVDGDYLFQIGEDRFEAHPGDFVWATRGVAHTFLNIGSAPSRVTVVISPSGMEEFFLKLAAIPAPPSPQAIEAVFAEYGLELLGPPISS